MKAIVVVDRNWGIGKENRLLIHLPGDLKNFKRLTEGNVVVMGRKTLESLPGGRPLPDRTTIVLSADPKFDVPEGVLAVRSAKELFQVVEAFGTNRTFLCGGGSVYREFLPYCDQALVTKIDGEFPADCHFPNLDAAPEWEAAQESEPMEDGGVSYRFVTYVKKVEK